MADSLDTEPDELPPDTIEAYFIAQLRRMRLARDLSQARLGKLLNYSDGQVSMVEAGHRRPTLDFARRCDRFFETGRVFTDLIPMMGRETLPAWYHRYTVLEAQASAIQTCEVQTRARPVPDPSIHTCTLLYQLATAFRGTPRKQVGRSA
jgi:transcriptional regulator with XRE-family HTH domain